MSFVSRNPPALAVGSTSTTETVIFERQREYYAALAASDKAGNSTAFIEFMLTAIADTLAIVIIMGYSTLSYIMEVYMRYEGLVYRPPSEANSVLIQATIGCPHNRCAFCSMYRDKAFRIRPVADIKEDMLLAKEHYGDDVESIFFPDGNSIIMKTDQLVEIFQFAHEIFPRLQRLTIYGSARFINLKTATELQRLKDAGLSRIHCGMESGDDVTLAAIDKGSTAAEMIAAGQKVKSAGIELSEYIMIGIGGRERSTEHAIQSAAVLNQIDPEFIRLRTFIPLPGSPLYDAYHAGRRLLLTPHEALRETRLFIENLSVTSRLYSDHFSNYAYINGKMPNAAPKMLKTIDQLLTLPEENFRPPATGSL